jgi:hypothetical protein
MRPLVVVAVLSLYACSPGEPIPAAQHPASAHACLSYRDTLELRGTLRHEVFPGPPNFQSVADGDEPHGGFYVHLIEVVCARPSTRHAEDPTEAPLDSVAYVQLVLDSAGYERLRPHLDQVVTVRGTIFSAHTGYHHAPVLLQIQ